MNRKEKEIYIKKKIIIDAAFKLFASKGFAKTTMNEIAKNADFTKPTLYAYYQSKIELCYAVLVDNLTEKRKNYLSVFESSLNGIEKLRACAFEFFNNYSENPSIFYLYDSLLNAKKLAVDEKLQKELKDLMDHNRNSVKDIFFEGIKDGTMRENIDPESAFVFFSISIGAMLQKLINNDNSQYTTFHEHLDLLTSTFENPEYRNSKKLLMNKKKFSMR